MLSTLAITGALTLQVVKPPNIVLIVADDLGYCDVGFNGSPDIPTPNIDSIANSGVTFTNAYVTSPICSPSRAGLLTGIAGTRFGYENNPPIDDLQRLTSNYGVPTDIPLLSERLASLGYSTGAVGKWHLGEREELRPTHRGFQEFYGFLEGGSSYMAGDPGMRTIYEGTMPVAVDQYLTDALSARAVRFIGDHARSPFFLYLAYNAPHFPLHSMIEAPA